MWDTNRDKIEEFLLKANRFHPPIRFTAEISETEMIFLDASHGTKVTDSSKNLYLMCKHILNSETSQYTDFYSCHPQGITKGFIKGEVLRLLRTNSSQTTSEENIRNFAACLKNRGYPAVTVVKHLSEVKFFEREISLTNKDRTTRSKILPFVTQYHPALPNFNEIHSWGDGT